MMSKFSLHFPRQFTPKWVAKAARRRVPGVRWPSIGWSWRPPAKFGRGERGFSLGFSRGFSRGFSLIEQIVAVGLVAVIVPSMAVLLSGLVRQASASGDAVAMLTLARSQLESIKEQPYQDLPGSYRAISPIPEQYAVDIATEAVKTYTYPAPSATTVLPDEIQLITVEVTCADCFPLVGALILQGYKVKR